jgi:hypothetical protein
LIVDIENPVFWRPKPAATNLQVIEHPTRLSSLYPNNNKHAKFSSQLLIIRVLSKQK